MEGEGGGQRVNQKPGGVSWQRMPSTAAAALARRRMPTAAVLRTRGQLHGVAHQPAQQRVLKLLCTENRASGKEQM